MQIDRRTDDSFLATSFAALVGAVLLVLVAAGVPDETGIALILGGALVLAPTVAVLAGCGRDRRPS